MEIETRRVILAALEAGVEEAKRTGHRKRRRRGARGLLAQAFPAAADERYTRRSAPGPGLGSRVHPWGGSPFPRGATVFENSTACAPLDRPLGRGVCPGSTPSLAVFLRDIRSTV